MKAGKITLGNHFFGPICSLPALPAIASCFTCHRRCNYLRFRIRSSGGLHVAYLRATQELPAVQVILPERRRQCYSPVASNLTKKKQANRKRIFILLRKSFLFSFSGVVPSPWLTKWSITKQSRCLFQPFHLARERRETSLLEITREREKNGKLLKFDLKK